MKLKKIGSLLFLLLGLCCVAGSYFILHEVKEGKKKIAHAEKKMDQGDALFSLSPATKELSKGLFETAQRKIEEGKQEVAKYESLAGWLQIAGFLFVALGAGAFFVLRKK